jgi:hypothetical protein
MIVPENMANAFSIYLIRTEPGHRDKLIIGIEERLASGPVSRIIRNLQPL